VYSAEVVSAFDPAEADPEDAKEEEAPGPVAPEDALDWMYSLFSLRGSF
jgi:hypothetical protein